MVQAQQYIEQNFPKDINIIIAIRKNLEGPLDLTEWPNLINVDLGFNPQLRSLKLRTSSRINEMSIYGTGINDYSFLVNLPSLTRGFCFPNPIKADKNNPQLAKEIRDISLINQIKDQEIERLKQQIVQLQGSSQQSSQDQQTITNLNSQINQLNQQIQAKDNQITNLNNQIREKDNQLTELKTDNDKLKSEIETLKAQEQQCQTDKTNLQQQLTKSQELLTANQQKLENSGLGAIYELETRTEVPGK